MANGNPTHSSPWTDTLLAPFGRTGYRTAGDLLFQSPPPLPQEAWDLRDEADTSDEDDESWLTGDDDDVNNNNNEKEVERAQETNSTLRAKNRSTYTGHDDQLPADEEPVVVKEDPTPQSAIAAWNIHFSSRPQLQLAREDALPFAIGQSLGGGGVGVVYETHIDGVPLALKRTWTRKMSTQQLNEIKILSRMSKNRHRHVVELIGSYVKKERRGFEIGMLIWPVAQTDLAALLHDIGVLTQYYWKYLETDCDESPQLASSVVEKIRESMEPLLALIPSGVSRPSLSLRGDVLQLLPMCGLRVRRSLGCIANAVAYLHEQNIRHKDLKPSQILLSAQGLWLADFGWSADMSELSSSVTSGGDVITAKYQAPERANLQPCGRAEDIFSLGCIFLEMTYCTSPLPSDIPRPWLQRAWSFQANLKHVQDWMEPLYTAGSIAENFKEDGLYRIVECIARLPRLLVPMLAPVSNNRPSIQDVLHVLSATPLVANGTTAFIADCCAPRMHLTSVWEIADIIEHDGETNET